MFQALSINRIYRKGNELITVSFLIMICRRKGMKQMLNIKGKRRLFVIFIALKAPIMLSIIRNIGNEI
jgi:hypothetical protein